MIGAYLYLLCLKPTAACAGSHALDRLYPNAGCGGLAGEYTSAAFAVSVFKTERCARRLALRWTTGIPMRAAAAWPV